MILCDCFSSAMSSSQQPIPSISYTSSSKWPFVELYCEHLPASPVVHYFKQGTMSTSANGVAVPLALPQGIFLFLLCLYSCKVFALISMLFCLYATVTSIASSSNYTCTYMSSKIFVTIFSGLN